MKFIVTILLVALLGYAAPLFLSWWSFAITSLIIGFAIPQKSWKAFVAGFIGMFLLWAVMALMLDNNNDHLLSQKVAAILKLGNAALLIWISAFIGALVAGFSTLTGNLARKLK
jgi:hypothetical protein